MKPVAYKVIWLGLLLVLVLAARTVQAQSAEKGDQPVMPGGQAGSMQGQGSMEGMRGVQGGMGQMTCV